MTTATRWTEEEFAELQRDALRQEIAMATANAAAHGEPPATFTAWCQDVLEEDEPVFYRRADGSHGWWHPECGGLVQSG
jgi:hypothetical protein